MSALYRKHRPRDFSEVVGQEHVVRTLSNAITSDRVRHAYLFAGPRGTAKTSLARILAKSLNCLRSEGPTLTPCLECESCVAIQSATSLDVVELDAASNRGIDDIREIRDKVALRPVIGRRKVYILDEAHSLTTDASNALLKTLEEPPDHVVFVLCTTEAHKLLDTIKGRCQSFAFLRPNADEIRTVLSRVAALEDIRIDEAALALIARTARGSFRDAVSQLDQLATACGGEITAEEARALLGAADESTLIRVLDLLAGRDAAGSLSNVDDLVEGGQDIGALLGDLMAYARLIFLVQHAGVLPTGAPVTAAAAAAIRRQAEELPPRLVTDLLDGLLATGDELRDGGDPRLPLELLLVRLCRPASDRSREAMLRRLDALESGLPPVAATVSVPMPAPRLAPTLVVPAPPTPPAPIDAFGSGDAAEEDGPDRPGAADGAGSDEPPFAIDERAVVEAPVTPVPAPPRLAAVADLPLPSDLEVPASASGLVRGAGAVEAYDRAELERIWRNEVVPAVSERRPALAPSLAVARPLELGNGALHVGFPAAQAFSKAKADTDAHRALIGEALTAAFGERVRVVFRTIEEDEPAVAAPAPVAVLAQAHGEDDVERYLRDEMDAFDVDDGQED